MVGRHSTRADGNQWTLTVTTVELMDKDSTRARFPQDGKPPKGIRKWKLKVYKRLKVYERLSMAQNDCNLTHKFFIPFCGSQLASGQLQMYKSFLRRIVTALMRLCIEIAKCWQRRQTRYSHLPVSARGRRLLTFAVCRFDSSTNWQRARGSLTSRRT